ncbi:MAG: hypothetical protein RI979_52 [Pseudomonadota bacterium]|jgi:branched-chain amino acid transport system substrate-binding protein
MKFLTTTALAMGLAALTSAAAFAEDTIKVAIIEPLSGPLAANGADILERFQFIFNRVNAAGGVLGGTTFEVIGIDNGWDVEKTAQAMQQAADQGVDFVINGIGPQHAAAVQGFIKKHNDRNPGNEMAFLVHSATDSKISNENCTFWQAVFDPTVEMKLQALVEGMKAEKFGSKVFMINPDFEFGHAVDEGFKSLVGAGETGLELVGAELMAPFGQVTDFTPLIARIQASGADVVLTGNFGPDLIGFIQAATDAGLKAKFATLYGDDPSSMGALGADRYIAADVMNPVEYNENDTGGVAVLEELNVEYREVIKSNYGTDRYRMMVDGLVAAIGKAGSAEPKDVMANIGGVEIASAGGTGYVRAEDHQLIIPYFVMGVDKEAKHTVLFKGDDKGFGWKTRYLVPAEDMAMATRCEMTDKP